MATKPTDLPRWGTDATNESNPASGQKDTGWTTGQVAVSSYENWLKRVTYEWISYLNDGVLTGNHSIAGDVTITAGAASGNLTMDDGALVVTTGNITATAGNISSVAGDVYHGLVRTLCLSPCMGQWVDTGSNDGGYSITGNGEIQRSSAATAARDFIAPIPLFSNAVIVAIRARVDDGTTDTWNMSFYAHAFGGSALQSVNSDGSGSNQVIVMTDLDAIAGGVQEHIVDDNGYSDAPLLNFTPSGTTDTMEISGIFIDYYYPSP